VWCIQYVYVLDFVYQKKGNCIIPTLCLWSRLCVSERGNCIIPTICLFHRLCVPERGKLYHTYNIFIFKNLCFIKRETLSYLQYVFILDFVYQKEGNCIIPTICLCPRLCVPERGKLYHTYNIFMWYNLCIRKRETVSYLQYIYVQEFMFHQEGNCIIPTIYLCSRLCVSERGKLCHA